MRIEATAEDWGRMAAGTGQQAMVYGSLFDPFSNSSSSGPRQGLSVLIAGALLSSLVVHTPGAPGIESGLKQWKLSSSSAQQSAPEARDAESAGSLVIKALADLEEKLQLTRSQLSAALQVERATLYQWFRGVQPRPRAMERIDLLQQFAKEWADAGLGSARASWHLRVPGSPTSLGDLLRADNIQIEDLRALIQAAMAGSMEAVPLRSSAGFPADQAEERRRRRDRYAPSYADRE